MTGPAPGPGASPPCRWGTDEERRWTQVGPDRPLHQGFQSVYARDYRLPDGTDIMWEMDGLAPVVGVLALTDDGALVMVRQFRPGPNRVAMCLPGGLVDPGEDPADAAARELREETGYTAASLEVVVSVRGPVDVHPSHVAIARGCRRTHDQDLDPSEDCEVVLCTPQEVRAELRAGLMTGTELAYLALDHAQLL
ncbi:MAG: NUDIX hydrolase [Nocardioides sp.]|nr:NUDIX hydrolase [Nocardioides sp.]